MVEVFIDKLIDLNIGIELLEHDQLKLLGNTAAIPDEVLAEIKERKSELINYLKSRQADVSFRHIPAVAAADHYPLSSMQQNLWILGQSGEGNAAYNVPGAYVLTGTLDTAALEQALDGLVERHEILRTVFREDEKGIGRQYILPPAAGHIRPVYHDLRGTEDPVTSVKELLQTDQLLPFTLSSGKLFRVTLYQTGDNTRVLTYLIHHIISDAWSMDLFINELFLFYQAAVSHTPAPLSPLRIQYKDYAVWQQEQLNGEGLAADKNYWLRHLEGELPVLQLPADKVRPAVKTHRGAALYRHIPASLADQIKTVIRAEECTLFMGLLAMANALFYRYTAQEDIIIGTPAAGREHIDLADQLGFYVNTMALRMQFSGDDSYRELLRNARNVTLGAHAHQAYPFDALVNALHVPRDLSRNPLFDVQVIVQREETAGAVLRTMPQGLTVTGFEGMEYPSSVFDLVFLFVESETGIRLNVGYNPDVYSENNVSQLADHFIQLLAAVADAPDQPVARLDYLTPADKTTLLSVYNNTRFDYPGELTLVHLFEEQVRRTPDSVAIAGSQGTLTYAALKEQSDRLAHYLREKYAVLPNQLAGIMLERSEEMVIAVLGVLKAGAAYVPIDPSLPRARKSFIMSDTGIQLLIITAAAAFDLDYYQGSVFAIDVELNRLKEAPAADIAVSPQQLAYVIYTSGSTGTPKGVMVEHRAVANSILTQRDTFELTAGEKMLQFFSFSFDVCVFEIFVAFAAGATLYIIPEEDKKSPDLLKAYLEQHAIDITAITPGYLKLLQAEKAHTLKRLIIGGEPVTFDTIAPFRERITCYNVYGPTECSIAVAVYKDDKHTVTESGYLPLGTPLGNIRLYILDGQLQLVPPGVTGEICIGGAGLARGYLNNPALTAEKFVDDPFNEGEKIYRTGDLGRWLPDGNMLFAGRKDGQVKISGYRIETGEITRVLQDHPDVKEALVIAGPDNGSGRALIAYVTGNEPLQVAVLQEYLGSQLPVYMIPAHFVQLDAFPLTRHGKIDQRKLPDPAAQGMTTGSEYIAPRNALETTMVKVWEEILEKQPVSITDDYFELGGSSLKAMMVIKRVMDETGIAIPLKVLFEQRTIAGMSDHINSTGEILAGNISFSYATDPDSPYSEVSYNERVYFSEWNYVDDPVITHYEFDELNLPALQQAITLLAERQEVLRTVYERTGDTIRRKVLPMEDFRVDLPEIIPIAEADIFGIMDKEYFRKYDLFGFPLFAISLFKMGDKYHLLLTLHHVITDGYSRGILKKELMALYNGAALQPLSSQYRNFAAWQHNFLDSPEGSAHQAYWLKKLDGFSSSIRLPQGIQQPNGQDKAWLVSIAAIITGEAQDTMDRFIRENGLTRTTFFLGILVLLFYHWSDQNDITVYTTVSGRNSRYYGTLDVSELVGFFTNLVLVRNRVDADMPVAAFLQAVQRGFLDDLSYDDYPVEKLLRELRGEQLAGLLSGSVFYNYHNYEHFRTIDYHMQGAGAEEERRGEMEMDMAFILAVTEYRNCLVPQVVFNGNLFNRELRQAIYHLYFSLLDSVIRNPERTLREILQHHPLPGNA